jgi:asparagine synthase (glutamine-hydrolysing)
MCGIAGFWSTHASSPAPIAAAMTAALHHRGPDSHGVWTSPDGALALGHARLAIVDLSEQGQQPMVSRSGRYVVVFNGEIYNHIELRHQLGRDLPWRGHSDTETLLEAVEQWGLERALRACVGMFALALWSRDDGSLSLTRDRMGEKPLYVGQGSNGLAFGSELKALHHAPGLNLELDRDALRGFVRFGFILGPRSAYQGVRKLSPGHILTLRHPQDTAPSQPYWTLPRPVTDHGSTSSNDRTDTDRLKELETLLRRSVSQQMIADVPLGAFLSGGIDSSLIVALMQQASTQPVRTYSMGFDRAGNDELSAARETARILGTQHTELLVTPQDVLDIVPRLAEIYDEPFADSSQVPTVLLSQLTRQHVTVALSGDAGDELFGGYNRYLSAAFFERRLRGWPDGLRHGLGSFLRGMPIRPVDALAQATRACGVSSVPPMLGEKLSRIGQFMAARSGLDAYLGTISQWLDRAPVDGTAAAPVLSELPDTALPQQMMWWDMQTYLTDDILVKVDRAAMSTSLETRVPFLDHRIVEYALSLPLDMKIRQGRSKWLLRKLLERELPTLSFDRPKQGFSVPLDAWLRGPLREWAHSLLDPQVLARSGLVDGTAVQRTWQEHLSGRRNHQRALWTVLMLQAWLNRQASIT